jgi:hypothetical protein
MNANPSPARRGGSNDSQRAVETYNAQYQRVIEGLRKAGLPEGEKKTN